MAEPDPKLVEEVAAHLFDRRRFFMQPEPGMGSVPVIWCDLLEGGREVWRDEARALLALPRLAAALAYRATKQP